jgi:SAM-dependent methyltransferase
MKQPYFTRILEATEPDVVAAFANGHTHMGYFDDPQARDVQFADFAAATGELTRRILAAAGVRDGMRVLDVGCGVGGTIAQLNAQHSNVDLVGLNISSRQLDIARSRVSARPGNSVSFIHGDACSLPFGNASFDALISIECLEHLPNRLRLFREARRVLRPGARMCLTDHVPIAAGLPFLFLVAVPLHPRLQPFFGDVNPWPCTPAGYRMLGRLAKFRQVGDEDLTPHTTPTYRGLQNLFRDRDASRALQAAEWLCRSGMVRYRVMTFV